MRLELQRKKSDEVQTLGNLQIYKTSIYKHTQIKEPMCINEFFTLELPDLGNQQNVSRIPAGIYLCKKGRGWKIPYLHIHILDVPNRSGIRIHRGNKYTEIKGCILCGDSYRDINNDGHVDILNSKKTLKKLLSMLPDRFELQIFDEK